MHEDCENLSKLYRNGHLYYNADENTELVKLTNLDDLSSYAEIFIQIPDDSNEVFYKIPMKYCIDCGKELITDG
jgi:hypothetical protein